MTKQLEDWQTGAFRRCIEESERCVAATKKGAAGRQANPALIKDPVILARIGQRLTDARLERGLSLSQMAWHLGCDLKWLAATERGQKGVRRATLAPIALRLGTTVEEMIA